VKKSQNVLVAVIKLSISSGTLSYRPSPQVLRKKLRINHLDDDILILAATRYSILRLLRGIKFNMARMRILGIAALLLYLPPSTWSQTKSEIITPSTPAVMSSAYGDKLKIPGIPNPGKINDQLYRGAQPTQQGLEELKKLGITTIVDLRAEDRAKTEWEKQQTERLGMRFVHIPVAGFAAPSNEDVAEFLSLTRSDPKQKVFVHCLLGEDRTGVFVAAYRMGVQKWPVAQAMHEMYAFGFNGFWHPAMKSFVRDFPARLTSAPALAKIQDPQSPAPIVAAPQTN
jgi:tyrosine-protein phosphatase SIW14